MTARRRQGPALKAYRELDGSWACRASDGRGLEVEVHQQPTREIAIRRARRDLALMTERRPTA